MILSTPLDILVLELYFGGIGDLGKLGCSLESPVSCPASLKSLADSKCPHQHHLAIPVWNMRFSSFVFMLGINALLNFHRKQNAP